MGSGRVAKHRLAMWFSSFKSSSRAILRGETMNAYQQRCDSLCALGFTRAVYATGPNSELKTDFRGNPWFCHGGGGSKDKRASKRERRKFSPLRAFYQGSFSEHAKKRAICL